MSTKPRPETWWMCLNPYLEGDKPEVRHEHFAAAQEEARRLCLKTGRKIHVLKCVGTYHPPQIPQPVWEDRNNHVQWIDRTDSSMHRAINRPDFSSGTYGFPL